MYLGQPACVPQDRSLEGANLCTFHHWFGRLSKICCEACHELPMSITRLQALVQSKVGSHTLPIEQGRVVKPGVPRHLHQCNLCSTAVGNERLERHIVFQVLLLQGHQGSVSQAGSGCLELSAFVHVAQGPHD